MHIEDLAQLQTRCLRDAEDALAVAEAARETAHRGDFTFLVDVVELSANRLGAAAAGGRSGVCRIATVGRTKAGKSTLRYVLTGQAENGIGIGGQRTTTSNLEYLWRDLEVVDTPGVGAFQGAEDAEVAAVAAAAADLVLWVVTSDGLQQATIRPVQDMLRRGVPLVVLINRKEVVDLTDLPRWTDAQLFEESDAHERRVRQVCRELGRSEVEVLHCHLDVAHLARNASDGSAWERSQLPQLEAALVAAAARAVRQRPRTQAAMLHAERVDAESAINALGGELGALRGCKQLDAEARTQSLAGAERVFKTDLARRLDAASRTARASLASALRLATVEEHRSKAQARLEVDVRALLQAHREAVVVAEQEAVQAAVQLVRDDCQVKKARSVAVPTVTTTLAGDPLNARAAQNATNVASAGSTFLGFLFPPLALLAPLATKGIGKALGPSVEDEQKKRDASVVTVRRCVVQALSALTAAAQKDAEEHWRYGVHVPQTAASTAAQADLAAVDQLIMLARAWGAQHDLLG